MPLADSTSRMERCESVGCGVGCAGGGDGGDDDGVALVVAN